MDAENYKLTFIIPNYNSGVKLKRAIESIDFTCLNKNHVSFQIIVVDDGSWDNSIKIIEKDYSEFLLTKKLLIINSNHQGAGSARNIGISNATSEFVTFLDSDDQFINFDSFVSSLQEEKDLIIFSKEVKNKSIINLKEKSNQSKLVLSDLGLSRKGIYDSGPCSKIFRLSLIKENNCFFPVDISVGEDLLFNLNFLKYCSEVVFINNPVYKAINNNQSITHAEHLNDITLNFKNLIYKVKILLSDDQEDIYQAFILKIFLMVTVKLVSRGVNLNFLKKEQLFIKNEFKGQKVLNLNSFSILKEGVGLARAIFVLYEWSFPKIKKRFFYLLMRLKKKDPDFRII